MAAILHGRSMLHNNHSHSHDTEDLLIHQEERSDGEIKEFQSFSKTQSDCQSENINMQAALLHVLGDFIQSIGVIIASILIKFFVSSSTVTG